MGCLPCQERTGQWPSHPPLTLETARTRTASKRPAAGSTFASRFDRPILIVMVLQLSGTSALALPKSIEMKKVPSGAIPALTPRTFVRAASLANLLVATLVFVEFSAIAIVNHDGTAFLLGLCLVPLLTLVIWGIAAVLCGLALVPMWFWTLRLRLIGRPSRSSPSFMSGVWDDWLDSPPRGVVPICGSTALLRSTDVDHPQQLT